MPAWLIPAIAAGAKGIQTLLDKPENPYQNPRKYKDQLTIDNGELAGIRGGVLQSLMGANAATQQNIKQVGAGTRAPKGAVMDMLAGANYNMAKGAASMEPQLQQMKMNADNNFANLMMRFDEGQKQVDQYNKNKWGNFVGDMGKIALLWQSGYFDDVDLGGQTTTGATGQTTTPNYIGMQVPKPLMPKF